MARACCRRTTATSPLLPLHMLPPLPPRCFPAAGSCWVSALAACGVHLGLVWLAVGHGLRLGQRRGGRCRHRAALHASWRLCIPRAYLMGTGFACWQAGRKPQAGVRRSAALGCPALHAAGSACPTSCALQAFSATGTMEAAWFRATGQQVRPFGSAGMRGLGPGGVGGHGAYKRMGKTCGIWRPDGASGRACCLTLQPPAWAALRPVPWQVSFSEQQIVDCSWGYVPHDPESNLGVGRAGSWGYAGWGRPGTLGQAVGRHAHLASAHLQLFTVHAIAAASPNLLHTSKHTQPPTCPLAPSPGCDGGNHWAAIGHIVEAGGIALTRDYQVCTFEQLAPLRLAGRQERHALHAEAPQCAAPHGGLCCQGCLR